MKTRLRISISKSDLKKAREENISPTTIAVRRRLQGTPMSIADISTGGNFVVFDYREHGRAEYELPEKIKQWLKAFYAGSRVPPVEFTLDIDL